MIKLKPGQSIRIGGKEYKGEIPEALCPENLKPKAKANNGSQGKS